MIETWKIDACAHAAHEANRAYSRTMPSGPVAPAWDTATNADRAAVRQTIYHLLANRSMTAAESHEIWVSTMTSLGWKRGKTKDYKAKTHPCLVAWDQLDFETQAKDVLVLKTAKAMLDAILSQPE